MVRTCSENAKEVIGMDTEIKEKEEYQNELVKSDRWKRQ